jgi:hypothetical protein
MGATLDDLLKLNGVVAVGEFTPDGKLADYQARMAMSPELAAMTAQFCATVTMMFYTALGRVHAIESDEVGAPTGLGLLWRRLDGGHWWQQGRVCRNGQGRLQSAVPSTRRPSVTPAKLLRHQYSEKEETGEGVHV